MNVANGVSGKLIFRAPIAQCAEVESITKKQKRTVASFLREALAQALMREKQASGANQEDGGQIITLELLTDQELSGLFASDIADIKFFTDSLGYRRVHPSYTTSADAVLPFLEKWDWMKLSVRGADVTIQINCLKDGARENAFGTAPTFARAACIAIIRAKLLGGVV